MPGKSANVKNEKQYEALKDKGMSKQRAAKIANRQTRPNTAASSPARRRHLPGRHHGTEESRRTQGRKGENNWSGLTDSSNQVSRRATWSASTDSGSAPDSSTASWKALMSNRSPCRAFAASRIRSISSRPIM